MAIAHNKSSPLMVFRFLLLALIAGLAGDEANEFGDAFLDGVRLPATSFFCAKDAMSTVEFHKILMNQVLPSAWSHNLLTTLKLICNFIDRCGDGRKRNQDETFFTTAVWLYQNHPKTLAYNLVPIFGSFGHILDLPRILSQVLRGEAHLKFTGRMREEADSNGMVKVKENDAKSKASELLLRRKAIHTTNKAA